MRKSRRIVTQCAVSIILVVLSAEPSASPASVPGLQEIWDLRQDGHYSEAEARARDLLTVVEESRGSSSPAVAEVLDLLVTVMIQGGKIRGSEALELARRALEIRQEALGPDSPEVSRSRELLARLFKSLGDLKTARSHAEQAVQIAEELTNQDVLLTAQSLTTLGYILQGLGDDGQAMTLFQRALELQESSLDHYHPTIADTLDHLAQTMADMGDAEAAVPLFVRSLEIRKGALRPDHPLVAMSLNHLAIMSKRSGDFDRAISLYEEMLEILETNLGPKHPAVALALNNLGNVLADKEELQVALRLHQRAMSIRVERFGSDNLLAAQSHQNLGRVLNLLGEYAQAKQHFEYARDIRERTLGPDHPKVADSLTGLGIVDLELKDYLGAIAQFERALSILERALGPRHSRVAQVLGDIGFTRMRLSEPGAAADALTRALEIQRESLGLQNVQVATTLSDLGLVARLNGDPTEAKRLLGEAVRMFEESSDRETLLLAGAIANLATVHYEEGEYAQARKQFLRAESIFEKAGLPDHLALASYLDGLGMVQLAEGDRCGALQSALRCEAIARSAFRDISPVLSRSDASRYARVRASGLNLALTVVASAGQDDAELPSTHRVFDEIVRSRAIVLDEMAGRQRFAHWGRNDRGESLARELRSASRKLSRLFVAGPDSADPQTYGAKFRDASEGVRRAERALAQASEGFKRNLERRQVDLDQVHTALPDGAALVAYLKYTHFSYATEGKEGSESVPVVSRPSYIAFVLKSGDDDIASIPLGPAETVDALVARWHKEISSPPQVFAGAESPAESRYRDAGTRLREAIWDPVASMLGGRDLIFVVPDGSINLVSFATLPSSDGGYLVEHERLIHYLSAERDLVRDAVAATAGQGLLSLGGPDFDADRVKIMAALDSGRSRDDDRSVFRGGRSTCVDFESLEFGQLPGAELEVFEIARLWDASRGEEAGALGRARQITGARASEEAFKKWAPTAKVLHIATHGFFIQDRCLSTLEASSEEASRPSALLIEPVSSGENPLLMSGLALAGANRRHELDPESDAEDGILTAEEIAVMNLIGVDWAVLSACETGVGRVQAGEGVLGLRRAFEMAGVRTLIMSLWTVEDVATQTWMRSLFEARLGGSQMAEAVRLASLRMIAKNRSRGKTTHPFSWGAFIAAGDWR